MNWKTTWLLLTLAAVLFAFIYLVERHTRSTSAPDEPPPRLLTIRSGDVIAIQLRQTNKLFLRVELTNGHWNITFPVLYPAQDYAIEALLENLSTLTGRTHIPMEELAERQQTIADFGLDVPVAAITLEHGAGRRSDVYLGSKTPVGDQVYVRLLTQPGIYVVPSELFNRLPSTASAWRNPALVDLSLYHWDRMEARIPSGGFELRKDRTNNLYLLTKPMVARAHIPRIDSLQRVIESARVVDFVTDDPRAELDRYGLQPPEAELAFGHGSNDLVVVQFGKSPTNVPNLVYARRLSQTNIVLVPRDVLDALRVPASDLRDRRLLAFQPAAVKTVEVTGPENFVMQRQDDGGWVVSGAPPFAGDPELIRRTLERLSLLEGVVEKDLVTVFASYGLEMPLRQYILKAGLTNAPGGSTNQIIDQLDLGARVDEKVFARRAGESSVYAIVRADFDQLPAAAWQLRDRHVWSFSPNQIRSVTISHRGQTRRLMRNAAGIWALAPGSSGVISRASEVVNKSVASLGQLSAEVWVERGNQKRALYGFNDQGYKIILEREGGDKPQELTLEFGAFAKSQFPYAMATVEGQSWIFEFPLHLYVELRRDLLLFPGE